MRFGFVSQQLRRKRRAVAHNDIWIAALCIEYDMPLVTQDRDFDAVDGLRVIGW